MDSHFPIISLEKPFYGKCLPYLIMAHCSAREYPLRFLLVPRLRTWGRLNQWTQNFGFLERCRFMFAIVQTHQSKVLSYAAVVYYVCNLTYKRTFIAIHWILCVCQCSERKPNSCIIVHLEGFLRGWAVCLKMFSGNVVLSPFICPLWTAKHLPAGSSCVADSWESSQSCCPCFWQKGVHTLVPVSVRAVRPLTGLSDLSRSCWWNWVLWKLALWAPW